MARSAKERGFKIEGEGHVHVPKQEHPHVATEYVSAQPDVAADLSRQLRAPFRARVVPASLIPAPRPLRSRNKDIKEAIRNAEAA